MNSTENKLLSLGFLKGGIVEAIISTYDLEDVPDAAPMGVTLLDSGRVMLRPYTSTVTFTNLEARRCAVINISSDPLKFLRTALKEANPGGVLPREWFDDAKVVEAPRLKGSDAFVEVSLLQITTEHGKRANVTCNVELVEALAAPAKAYCRASSALIEAVIHATRVKEFTRLSQHDAARDHRELMSGYLRIVQRVAPESAYSAAAAELRSLVEHWGLDADQGKGAA